ncbi:MAG TPA: DNA gyrase C-terminal beta-propeller domain-containing protein, partial [Leptospiraceae bacterium]|nr:DNA gyrase C-terminal beta-propeller domain-containing protein [Leptospiraceae bacterium]
VRRTKYELRKAEEKAHILEGLKIALDNIDEVIRIIRASKTPDEAKTNLMSSFSLSEVQTKAILDMRLQRLTSLEVRKIMEELEEIRAVIADLKDILSKPERVSEIVVQELEAVAQKFGTKRKTEISLESVDTTGFDAVDLIADEDVVVQITEDQYVKRLPIDTFKRQKRGGKGVQGGSTKRDDIIKMIRIASTHDTLMLFSDRGKAYALKVYELPQATKEARGKSLRAILNLQEGERITSICNVKDFSEGELVMVTKLGIIKKTKIAEFSNVKKNGIIAIGLRENDSLLFADAIDPKDDIILASRDGLAVRTNLSKLRSQGRTAGGVIGMRLSDDDVLIGVAIPEKESDLLVITEKGYGKRTEYSEFAVKGRGGLGLTYLKITDKNGPAIGVATVRKNDEIIIMAQSGMIIRVNVEEISQVGRSTVGVRVVNIKDEDKVIDFALISEREEE